MNDDIKKTGQDQNPRVNDSTLKVCYANVTRLIPTPNEMILDFGLNPNLFGNVIDEGLRLETRVVMSYDAAKRLCIYLTQGIQQYETRYGSIELDIQKRAQKTTVPQVV